MNKTTIIIVVLMLIGVGIYFATAGSRSVPTSIVSNPAPVSNTSAAIQTSDMTVSIKSFAFSPSTLAVKTGTKVTWTNNDAVPHTVTSDSGGLLNSPTLAPGQSFTFTFTAPGSVSYHCAIHTMMKGAVNVTD